MKATSQNQIAGLSVLAFAFIALKYVTLDFYFVLNLILFSLFSFAVVYIGKIWFSYRYFNKIGIKTPEYEFFYGNCRQMAKEQYSNILQKWTNQLGKTYGYYEGHFPVFVTSDLDIIQEVFIKQYANFSARKRYEIAMRDDAVQAHLFSATKQRWKRMRVIMNPTFSSAKLREICPLIGTCTNRLIECLKKNVNEFNVTEIFKRFTMDTIWNCAFGVDIDLQNNPENEYFKKCEQIFQQTVDINIFGYFGLYCHEFKLIIFDCLTTFMGIFGKFFPSFMPALWIINRIGEVTEKRQKEKINRKDLVGLMVEAQTEDNKELDEFETMDLTQINLNKKLTNDEIKMNLFLFMLAGYETTSTTLSYCTYVLAKHPEEQQKLFDEINYAFNNNNESTIAIDDNSINHDNVNKLEYLDMFIKEVLRCYPIGNTVVARRCTNPTIIKGIEMKIDSTIVVDVLSIHNDPELWGPVDPKVFYPQRFSPEIKRNPLAFAAFGLGPRNCIGMKFALVELKMTLVKLISTYEIKPTENTPDVLEFTEGVVRTPKNGVTVLLKKRN